MADFNLQLAQTPVNPLLGYAAQGAAIRNQSGAQDLADRATLRGLAPGLAAGDPNAGAQAAVVSGGDQALAGLSNMHEDQRRSLANTLDVTGAISGAILAADPSQRAALYDQFRPVMVKAGATGIPEQYPGDDYLNSHRAAATTVAQQLAIYGSVPTTDPYRTPLSLPAGPKVGPGGVMQSAPAQGYGGAGMSQAAPLGATDDYASAIIGGESGGNPTATNPRSSATGAGQFTDGTWLGLLPIVRPDLANLSPQQQLALRNDPNISRQMVVGYAQQNAPVLAAAGVPVTPTTLAVAHGFGAEGATRVLKADPATPMEAIYPPTVQNGQQVPNPVMKANPQYAGKTAGQVVQTYSTRMAGVGGQRQASAPQQQPQPQPQPVQTASLAGTTGMPQTANDASEYDDEDGESADIPATAVPPGGFASPNAMPAQYKPALVGVKGGHVGAGGTLDPGDAPATASPTDQPASVSDALARARAGTPAPTAPAIQNPNPLLSATPQGAFPTQRNALMPPTQAAPQQMAQAAPAAAPTNAQPLYRGGAFIPGNTPGYIIGITPDGQRTEMRAPGAPPKIKTVEVEGQLVNVDENTGQEVPGGRIPVPSKGRITFVDTPQGRQATQDGKPVGDVIPFSGRPEQKAAYDADRETTRDLIQNNVQADTNMLRLNETADIARSLETGPTAETRAKAAAIVQSTMGDSEAAKFIKDTVLGMPNPAAAQMLTKLGLTGAGAAAKGDLGANNGIQATLLYKSANPGLELLPDANKRLINQQRVVAQASKDYATSALDAFGPQEESFHNGGPYKPLTAFNRQWAEQNNPQVYAAAMGILNGDKFEDWSKRVDPAQAQRAAQIVARIDPKAMVPGRGGDIPVTKFLPPKAPSQ